MPIFGNPLGFLALAALPAILAIHFLQRESRRLATSTLFLLECLAPESAQGRRFERLRSSVPLWLQLLAALIATWLLVQPRWIRVDAAQHVVIVLDSTVSMQAFRNEMLDALSRDTAALARAAVHTEWQVLESDTTRPTVYSGPSREALLDALQGWKPHLGTHDPSPQLEAAQNLLGGKGMLVFVSDRKRDLPNGVLLLAVGHPFDHCGFAGLTVQDSHWTVLVRNNGRTEQRRNWWMQAGDQKGAPQILTLPPDGTLALSGSFPAGSSRCELVMDADVFPLDSRMPMLRPQLKRLTVQQDAAPPELVSFFDQFRKSLDRVEAPESLHPANLELAVYDPANPHLPSGPAIVFFTGPAPANNNLGGSVTPVGASLASELDWAGLLVPESAGVPGVPGDETLVWQGNRPLLFLRRNGPATILVVNFDLRASNAGRLPAFVLLLHRFVEEVRAARVESESRNFETNELLAISSDSQRAPPVIAGSQDQALRAPTEPGFFQVNQGREKLLEGAAHFADARAADFRQAATIDNLRAETAKTLMQNSQADLFAPAWMLALGLVMAGSWMWRRS